MWIDLKEDIRELFLDAQHWVVEDIRIAYHLIELAEHARKGSENPILGRARRARYRVKNREACRARSREYYAKNKEYWRKRWQAKKQTA